MVLVSTLISKHAAEMSVLDMNKTHGFICNLSRFWSANSNDDSKPCSFRANCFFSFSKTNYCKLVDSRFRSLLNIHNSRWDGCEYAFKRAGMDLVQTKQAESHFTAGKCSVVLIQ